MSALSNTRSIIGTQLEKTNYAKYLSYRLAHQRINAALESDFPLEAVAIIESILTDRFLSHANFHGAGFNPEKTSLGQVAPKCAKICRTVTADVVGEQLADKAMEWSTERNAVLHSIAKSSQGTGPKISSTKFFEHSKAVATEGLKLLKSVKSWHGRLVRSAIPILSK